MAAGPSMIGVKYWEIIADNLKKRGWSLGYVSAVDYEGRTIWIADAHRNDGKRFVVHADEKLTAFLEHERLSANKFAKHWLQWLHDCALGRASQNDQR